MLRLLPMARRDGRVQRGEHAHPVVGRRGIDLDTPLGEELGDIGVAEAEPQAPAHREGAGVGREAIARERGRARRGEAPGAGAATVDLAALPLATVPACRTRATSRTGHPVVIPAMVEEST